MLTGIPAFPELLPHSNLGTLDEPLPHGRRASRCMTCDQASRVEFKPEASPLVSFAMKAETTARPAGHDSGLCGGFVRRQASTARRLIQVPSFILLISLR